MTLKQTLKQCQEAELHNRDVYQRRIVELNERVTTLRLQLSENARRYEGLERTYNEAIETVWKLREEMAKKDKDNRETAAFLQKQYGKTFDVAHERGIIMHALAREIERLRGREDTV